MLIFAVLSHTSTSRPMLLLPCTHHVALRAGNDKGTQYASVIYCYNEEQFAVATRVKEQVQSLINSKDINAYSSVRVTTDVRHTKDASPFFPAHKEHQDYLTKNPTGYCNHGFKIKTWPQPAPAA